jgi:integrase
VGEALAIRPEHCERDTVRIVQSKTRAGVRTIVVPREAKKALDVMLKNSPTRYDAAHRLISTAYKRAGVDNVDVHSLRRTCAQSLLDCEVPEHVAAAMIGHAHRPLTFGLYARGPGEKALREAAKKVSDHLLAK